MTITRPIRPDPAVQALTDADLRAWWKSEFADVISVGVGPERLAETMFSVGAAQMAEALGPRLVARMTYLLALRLFADADRIDRATATAVRGSAPQ